MAMKMKPTLLLLFSPLAALLLSATLQLSLASTAAASSSTGASSSAVASPFHLDPAQHQHAPSLRRDGLLPFLAAKWSRSRPIALLEQAVEDHNAEHVATSSSDPIASCSYRRCIALPLDGRLFDPPMGSFSRGHVDAGDKMSLPRCFFDSIARSGAEVPWLFEVSRLADAPPRVALPPDEFRPAAAAGLARAVGGALDFRAPDNYAFLPGWMFTALGLRPCDVVDVRLVTTTPPGSAVRLRPHSSAFTSISNHQAVLETELKHYSALTLGTTIPFNYRGERYEFDVVDLRSSPRGERVAMAKVQDCDIAAEFVRAKDQLKPRKKTRQGKESNEE